MEKSNKFGKNRLVKNLLIIILILGILGITSTTILNYNVKPTELYKLNSENSVDDGGFENFNQTVGDCCNTKPSESKVFVSKSTDSYEKEYSVNLTSKFQCACINKPILNLNNIQRYFLSFYYKGDNPKLCNYVNGENKCLPNQKLNESNNWQKYNLILKFSELSKGASIYFYADSDGSQTVTNLYDDLQVHQLILIEKYNTYEFNSDEQYVFKTKSDNIVNGEIISDVINGEAYYLVTGEPQITIRFPWTELVFVIILMLIVIRLLFKKEVQGIENKVWLVVKDSEKKIEGK